jgi:hypothetical protein
MTGNAAVLARYKQLRQVGLELNNRLMEALSKADMDEGGKKLSMLRKNVLTLDSEDEIAVFADFCLHDVRRQGRTAIERFAEKATVSADEGVLLEALQRAWYSLFLIERAERGVGVHARDLMRNRELFIVDVSFGQTATAGMVLAARVMEPEGITMTTGAALPLGVLPPAALAQFLQETTALLRDRPFEELSKEELSDLTATIIRDCRRHGAAEHIEYREPGSLPEPRRAPRPALPSAVRDQRRNKTCPCGSGKKYRNCCGARR